MSSVNTEWDKYWVYGRPVYRQSLVAPQLRGVTKESVTCVYCDYVPRPSSTNPRRNYRSHLRKKHTREYYLIEAPDFIIKEEDDLLFQLP